MHTSFVEKKPSLSILPSESSSESWESSDDKHNYDARAHTKTTTITRPAHTRQGLTMHVHVTLGQSVNLDS